MGPADGEGSAAVQELERVARAVLGAWDLGTFFPRLVEPDRDEEPVACSWCEVKDACLRGDSTARIRLREWAHDHTQATLPDVDPVGEGDTPQSAEEVLLGVWRLPAGGSK